MKNHLLMTACALALTIGASAPAAFAQAAAEPETAAVSEVVITAERRTQSVQKSSLAIQVLSAETIQNAGVSQIRDLTTVTPGVQIGQGGPATQIYIRGVGDFGALATTNAAVATYIDGVFVPRSNAIEGNFYDIQRVEVLKGPQGTLYGRNSAGGALNVLSNAPVLGETSGRLNAQIGNYQAINVDGFLNVPASDTVAVRAAFQIVSRDGYASLGFDDDRKQSARLQVLWEPSEALSLKLGGAFTHVGGVGPGYMLNTRLPDALYPQLAALGVTVPTDPRVSMPDPRAAAVIFGVDRLIWGQGFGPFALNTGEVGPFNGAFALPYCLARSQIENASVNGVRRPLAPTNPGLCNVNTGQPANTYVVGLDPTQWPALRGQDNQYWNLNAELNWSLGFADLTVIPAYRRVDNDYQVFHLTPYDNGGRSPEVSESTSLEVRFARDTALVDWTAGAYYFRERQVVNTGSKPGELQGGFLTNGYQQSRLRTRNFAAFAQGTWHVAPDLRVITGLRYSKENKFGEGEIFNVFPHWQFAPGFPCFNNPTLDCRTDQFRGDKDFSATNWKLGVEYDLTPQNMVFATAATGFKAGGLNQASVNYPVDITPIFYDPEELTAYELGSRNRFYGGRLQVNLEAFYWIYKDHQDLTVFARPNGSLAGATLNSGKASLYGADVDIVARVTPNDTIQFNAEYNHTNYDDFRFLSSPFSPLATGCGMGPSGTAGAITVDCSGFPLVNAPLWSGSGSYSHVFDLASGGDVEATVSGQYSASRYLGTSYADYLKAPSYFAANLSVTYNSPSRNLSATAFVRNLTDEVVYTGAFSIRGFQDTLSVVNVGAPRTYGARVGIKF